MPAHRLHSHASPSRVSPRISPPRPPIARLALVAVTAALATVAPGPARAQGRAGRDPAATAPAPTSPGTVLRDGRPGWSYDLRYWTAMSRLYALHDLPPPLPPAIRTARTLAELQAASAAGSLAAGLSAGAADPSSAADPAPVTTDGWGSSLLGWLGRPGSGGARDARVRAPLPKDRLTVVLLGTDRRPGDPLWRTDTIMVASVDWASGRVGLLSVPRDLWVSIPGYGPGRINTADYLGETGGKPDAELVKDTLALNLGVRPDRYVRIDLEGFVKVVDALGGLDLVVDCPVRDLFRDPQRLGGRAEIDLAPGVHHVDGATALRYARSRHGSSDFARAHRQQRVLRAVQAAVRRRGWLDNGLALWPAVAADVETDLTPLEIATLAFRAAPLADRVDVRSRTLGPLAIRDWTTPDGAQVLVMDPSAVASAVADALSLSPDGLVPDGRLAAGSPAASDGRDGEGGSHDTGRDASLAGIGGGSGIGGGPGPGGAATAPAPVASIVNATGHADWGAVAEAALADRAVRVARVEAGTSRAESIVYFPPGADAAGLRVAEALGLPPARLRPAQTAVREAGLPVRVILGTDWAPCPQGY